MRRPILPLAALVLTLSAGLSPKAAAAAETKKPAAPEAKPATTAKISIDPMSKDAGTVAKGEKIEANFVVKNTGTQDLLISEARPSCGCTVASFDKTIKPGQSGKIVATVDTKNFTGPITKTISVTSNDPETPQLSLMIKANVKPYVEAVPAEFVRFSAIKGDSATSDVTIVSAEPDFHPTPGVSAQPYVKAQILPVEEKEKIAGKAGAQYKVRVSLEPGAPVGILNAPVKIKTGVAKQPEIEIHVSGIVRDRLSVSPATIAFGNFTPGKDVISRNVTFLNNKPAQAVKVLKAESTIAGLSVEVVPMTEGVNYTVVLKPKEGLKKGEFSGAVKIFTSDKERPVIEVPVSGTVL